MCEVNPITRLLFHDSMLFLEHLSHICRNCLRTIKVFHSINMCFLCESCGHVPTANKQQNHSIPEKEPAQYAHHMHKDDRQRQAMMSTQRHSLATKAIFHLIFSARCAMQIIEHFI